MGTPSTERARSRYPGWVALHAKGASKTSTAYRHEASGWVVEHCGHMTAIHPYSARLDGSEYPLVIYRNGKGFDTLLLAIAEIEALLRGERVLSPRESDRYRSVHVLEVAPAKENAA